MGENDMTDNKKDEKKATNKFEEEFAALPLEEKIAALFRMESKTLGETLTYIANSSAKAVEMSSKIEFEVKRATGESASAEGNAEPKASSAKPKSGERKRGAKPKAPAE